MRIPRKSGENPHKIPHSNEISPLWGKSGFYCIFINKSFRTGNKHEQIYETWTSLQKSVALLSLAQFQTNTLFCFTKQSNVKDYVPKLGSYPQICIFRADLYHLLRNLL